MGKIKRDEFWENIGDSITNCCECSILKYCKSIKSKTMTCADILKKFYEEETE